MKGSNYEMASNSQWMDFQVLNALEAEREKREREAQYVNDMKRSNLRIKEDTYYVDYNGSFVIFTGGLQVEEKGKKHIYGGLNFGTPWPSGSITGGNKVTTGLNVTGQVGGIYGGQLGWSPKSGFYYEVGFASPAASVSVIWVF